MVFEWTGRKADRQKESDSMISIQYEPEKNCVAAYDDDKQIGVCQYEVHPDQWIIFHTFTEPEYGGQGIARKMAELVAEQARNANIQLDATCWYAKKVLNI